MEKLERHEEIVESNGSGNIEMDTMETLLDVSARQNIEENITIKRPNRKTGKETVLKFKIRAISGEEYKRYQEQATTRIRDRKAGGVRTEFDYRKSQRLVVYNCVVSPDLKNKKLADAYNVNDMEPEMIVEKALLPGEIDYLAEWILEISGYTEEVLEKVKA